MDRKTLRRSRKLVSAHIFCAVSAASTARSMAAGVAVLMKPRNWPVAGAKHWIALVPRTWSGSPCQWCAVNCHFPYSWGRPYLYARVGEDLLAFWCLGGRHAVSNGRVVLGGKIEPNGEPTQAQGPDRQPGGPGHVLEPAKEPAVSWARHLDGFRLGREWQVECVRESLQLHPRLGDPVLEDLFYGHRVKIASVKS